MKNNNCHSTGVQGEEVACRYLLEKGYQILDRNYRSDHYEIDIVAISRKTIVFCEVKTSRTDRFGSPITWVTPKKTKRISLAAQDYIASHDTGEYSVRFDVIGIEVRKGKPEITHIEDAFTVPEDR